MLTTYKLSDGGKVVGRKGEVDVVDTSGGLKPSDWADIDEALRAGRIVLNLAHIVLMRPANEVERGHYDNFGAG